MIRLPVALFYFVILGCCQSQFESQLQVESDGNRRFGFGEGQEQLDLGQIKHEGSKNNILDPHISKPSALGEEIGGENRARNENKEQVV